MRVLRRMRDWRATLRTFSATSGRECVHDGTTPMCLTCACWSAGWP